ncbi:DUF1648 domain-containing protein [Oceanobacillus manasiensis]|uniref:DUF1648 domain-containing protein n=1 Tax=Oceanobacillus manasiensis TaxID=586413 RepID=UPI0005A6EACC|nr:DUF1648 domain-containing protein [Oceanobacillus manasiensis]
MSQDFKRPKLKIPKTKIEWAADIIGYLFFLGTVGFLIYQWNNLPNEVPVHYNAQGEVDNWESKFVLILLPAIGVLIAVMMEVFERFPEWHNYPARLNQENVKAFYLSSRKMTNQIKNICFILFGIILIESITIALGWISSLPGWLLPLMIISTLIPIVIGLIQQKKIK